MSDTLPSSLPASLRRFGRYSLLHRIAVGGMAEVYLANFTGTDGFHKLVVIKLIHRRFTASPEFVTMFVNEARLASRISHANVAQVLELGRVGETHFIAMEYVDGESLEVLAQRVPDLALPYLARIVANAAAGLHAAHELRDQTGKPLDVVHRDVSPANILINYGGEAKVIDFGVARALDSASIPDAEVQGRYAYMAPEQARGEAVDRRADVFSLGVVLHELTTRRPLFGGESEAQTLTKLLSSEIPRPTGLVPGYPPALEQVVMRALERDPAARFQTAQELQEALERFIVASGDPVLPAQVGQMMRRVFDDEIAEKRALLSRCLHEVTAPPEGVEAAPGGRRRLLLLSLLGGGLAVVLAVVLLVVFSGGGSGAESGTTTPDGQLPPDATAAPKPDTHVAPATITVSIRVTPEHASLTFDGKAVGNPFETSLPLGLGEVEAVASARGYVEQRFKVSLRRDSEHVIMLRRKPRHHGSTHQGSTQHGNKGHNGEKEHGGVLVNPYKD